MLEKIKEMIVNVFVPYREDVMREELGIEFISWVNGKLRGIGIAVDGLAMFEAIDNDESYFRLSRIYQDLVGDRLEEYWRVAGLQQRVYAYARSKEFKAI
jgi:hypothetical protein